MEPVLDALRTMRLSGAIFLEAEFTAPWCVMSRVTPEDCGPYLPAPRRIVAYHYVTEGSLYLEVEGREPATAGPGTIIVLPRNDAHRLGSGPGLRAVGVDHLIRPGVDGGPARIVHGGGGARARVLCGFLGAESAGDPVLGILPAALVLDVREAAGADWMESSLRFAALELARGKAGAPAVLARLAELLFVEAVRRYLATLPADERGWPAGVGDPAIGRALALLHGPAERRWTTEELAREAGLSRSAFAERFTRVMGEPPMRYLARHRMREAARRLRETAQPIARIAHEAGYESEAAFHRAFKRAYGLPPATWRKAEQRARPGAAGPPEEAGPR